MPSVGLIPRCRLAEIISNHHPTYPPFLTSSDGSLAAHSSCRLDPSYLRRVKSSYLLRVRNLNDRGTPYKNPSNLPIVSVVGYHVSGTLKLRTRTHLYTSYTSRPTSMTQLQNCGFSDTIRYSVKPADARLTGHAVTPSS